MIPVLDPHHHQQQKSNCKDGDQKKFVPSLLLSSSSSSSETETETETEIGPGQLFDESWFFGNLLIHTKQPNMSRCYSDPSPSSSSVKFSTEEEEDMIMSTPPGKSMEETFSLLQKLPRTEVDGENSVVLVRAPSLPEESSRSSSSSSMGRGKKTKQQRRLVLYRGNSYSTTQIPPPPPPPLPPPVPVSSSSSSSGNYNNLLSRAPSLPSYIGGRRDEIFQQDESDFSMSKLIRQASLKKSDTLPPRNPPLPIPVSISKKQQSSVIQQGTTITTPAAKSRPETEPENPAERMIEKEYPVITGRKKLTKSSSDLVFKIQELEDLGRKTDALLLSGPNTNRDNPSTEEIRRRTRKRSQLQKQKSMDTQNKNSVEDMKEQIKFWARAVASNVRQEC